jgi:hypothetical protein
MSDIQQKSYLDVDMNKLSAVSENPLTNIPKEQLLADSESFQKEHGLVEYIEEFKNGTLLASQSPNTKDSYQYAGAVP